jgi:hypothetical protein
MFTPADVDSRERRAVLGVTAAERLFGAGVDPTGRSVHIRSETFTVTGVTGSKVEDQAESVFVPYTVVQAMKGGGRHLDTVTIAAEQAGEASRIAERPGRSCACAIGSDRAMAAPLPGCRTTSRSEPKRPKR